MAEQFKKFSPLAYVLAVTLLSGLSVTFGRHWSAQYILRCFQIVGVISIFNIAVMLVKNGGNPVSRLADSSFFIYASHIFIISAISFLLSKLLPSTNQVMLALKYLLSAAITVALCEGVFQIMKRACPGFLSFICGNHQRIH